MDTTAHLSQSIVDLAQFDLLWVMNYDSRVYDYTFVIS